LAQPASSKPDHTVVIEPVTLELAPNKVIKTVGYNGQVPGPSLRNEGFMMLLEYV
jgi:hypothetical protein